MMSLRLIIFLTVTASQKDGLWAKTLQDVTFGSSFKLVNVAHQDVRLHSQEIKYGSGSGQQSVTGLNANDDANSHWVVKGHNLTARRGNSIRCGQKIRLEHSSSSKNLHSHHFPAPLSSHHQEISAYGENGIGDSGDLWEVVCTQKGSKTWKRDEPIQLRHINTNVFLGLSGRSFGRPITGQYEVVGVIKPGDSGSKWTTAEGIFIHPSETLPGQRHSEHDDHEEL